MPSIGLPKPSELLKTSLPKPSEMLGLPQPKGGTGRKPAKLETVRGLEQTAKKAGLEDRVAGVKKQLEGEKPKELFSGGTISDIFDALSVGQFAAAGFAKEGVKGIKKGIRERASFADEELLGQFGTTGKVAGIAADIIVDPLNLLMGVGLIPKVGKVGKLIEAGQAAEKAAKTTKGSLGELTLGALKKGGERALESSKPGRAIGEALVYRFGQSPVYKKLAETTNRNISLGIEKGMELARPLTRLSPEDQRKIADFRKAGKVAQLPPELKEKAKPAFNLLDNLGQEAVDLGLLPKEVYEQNVGRYIARLYRTKEIPKDGVVQQVFDKKPIRANLERFKKRKDIPEDIREAMGEILEAGYPTAKAIVNLTQAVGRTKFFNEVAEKFAFQNADEAIAAGLRNVDELKLPDSKALGALKGKWVPEPIFKDIQEIVRTPGTLEKLTSPIVKYFKISKVVLNPSTHARNIVSNFMLNDFEGLSPASLGIYGRAAKELATKGEIYQEAKKVGLGIDTFAASELRDMIVDDTKARGLGGKVLRGLKRPLEKISNLYQSEETFGKMAQYINQRRKGLSPEEAVAVAERATFNYAQVTPFIRRVRTNLFGVPFLTFTYKATPQIVSTAITKPGKISKIGKIARGVEKFSDQKELERERAAEPQWMKDGFFVKLPGKDKYGRSMYFDLTYIIPFGDLVTGGLIDRRIDRETGLPQGALEALAQNAPAFDIVNSLLKNQQFLTDPKTGKPKRIYNVSDDPGQQGKDILEYLAQQYLPSALEGAFQEEGTKLPFRAGQAIDFEQEVASGDIRQPEKRQSRTLKEELLRALAGLKVNPVSAETLESQRESELRRALTTLLEEQGEISQFSRPFIPRDKK